MKTKCTATTINGTDCTKWAMRGQDKCWIHAEGLDAERDAARRRGARTTNAIRGAELSLDIPKELTSIKALMKAVEFCIREALSERLDAKIANVIASLVRVQAGLIGDFDLECRVQSLEKSLQKENDGHE